MKFIFRLIMMFAVFSFITGFGKENPNLAKSPKLYTVIQPSKQKISEVKLFVFQAMEIGQTDYTAFIDPGRQSKNPIFITVKALNYKSPLLPGLGHFKYRYGYTA